MKNFKMFNDQQICDWARRVYKDVESYIVELDFAEDEESEEIWGHHLDESQIKLDILLAECNRRDIRFGINTVL